MLKEESQNNIAGDDYISSTEAENKIEPTYDDKNAYTAEVYDVGGRSSEVDYNRKWYDKLLASWLPLYSNSMVQIVILSFVVFLAPGMYNALTGIGASGIKPSVADNANVALYSTFAGIGFFGGYICNLIGINICLVFGGIGYLIYSASLLCYTKTENTGFVIFAGAFMGLCASCLWAAQGTIIMSYPTEDKKGRAVLTFWIIFNLGAVIGSLIALANNLENGSSNLSDSTFIAFIVLMGCGSIIALLMLPPNKVRKSDGTGVLLKKYPNWKTEFILLWNVLRSEKMLWLLFPCFFSSNWFYTYQFNEFNAGRFTIRTRSLNSLLYWSSQMLGATFIGLILDLKYFRRRIRARIGWTILFVFAMVIWGGGYKFQSGFTRKDVTAASKGEKPKLSPIDYKDGSYIGPMFLYMFYGVMDSMFQSYMLWLLGSMSNNYNKTSLYAGFYKGLQSAGAAVAFRLDSDSILIPYMNMFASCWALTCGSLLVGLPTVWLRVTDHTEAEEDYSQNPGEFIDILPEKSRKSIEPYEVVGVSNQGV